MKKSKYHPSSQPAFEAYDDRFTIISTTGGQKIPTLKELSKKYGTVPLYGARLLEGTERFEEAIETYQTWLEISKRNEDVADSYIASKGLRRCKMRYGMQRYGSAVSDNTIVSLPAPKDPVLRQDLQDTLAHRILETVAPIPIEIISGNLFNRSVEMREICSAYPHGGMVAAEYALRYIDMDTPKQQW